MPIDYGSNSVATSGNVNISGIVTATSGIFSNLTIGSSSFNSAVSGLFPSTLVYTTGNQSISGVKFFGSGIEVDKLLWVRNTTATTGIALLQIGGDTETSSRGRLLILNSDQRTVDISHQNWRSQGVEPVAEFLVPIITNTQAGASPLVIDPAGYLENGINPVGAITSGYWRGQTLQVDKGGTGKTSYTNGQLLIGSGNSLVANTLSGGNGINITNGSGSITISTTGLQNALTNPTTGTGAANHIAYWTSSSGLAHDSNQLFWDATNNRLGLGTGSPTYGLHLIGSGYVNGFLDIDNLRLDGNTISSTNSNGSVIISPIGTGTIQADSSGNTRGQHAIDWQRSRTSGNMVASGPFSNIAGGKDNRCDGNFGVVSGGILNVTSGPYSTIGGGASNQSVGPYCIVGGGQNNVSNSYWGVVAGGKNNSVIGSYSNSYGNFGHQSICGGGYNYVDAFFGFVGGGENNQVYGSYSSAYTSPYGHGTIAGGKGNTVNGVFSFIGGGRYNQANGYNSVVCGGNGSTSNGYSSVIVGGNANLNNGNYAGIITGRSNSCSASYSIIGGGRYNTVSSTTHMFVGGGRRNTVSGNYSIIVGGLNNSAQSPGSFIGGGTNNVAASKVRRANDITGATSTIVVIDAIAADFNDTTANRLIIRYFLANNWNLIFRTVVSATQSGNNVNLVLNASVGATAQTWSQVSVINTAEIESGISQTIGGGASNIISGNYSSINGGINNNNMGNYSTIVGGSGNLIRTNNNYSVIAGGVLNICSGNNSAILAGSGNSDNGHSNVFILGSSITATQANTTYTENLIANSGTFNAAVSSSGIITGTILVSSFSSGSEGGEIRLSKPATGSTLNGNHIIMDMFNNQLRIFEGSSPNRGYYLDISQGAAGAGTSLRNNTLTYFTPLDNQPPASGFATLDTRNSIAVLDFDDTTEESAVFVGVIPENAVLSSGISVRIHWMATSATSGNCRWGVQFEKMTSDLDSDSFDTATEAHSATNGTAGVVTITTITCTSIDSLAAGDLFRIKVYRDVSDTTNDTMVGDAEIVAIELRSVV